MASAAADIGTITAPRIGTTSAQGNNNNIVQREPAIINYNNVNNCMLNQPQALYAQGYQARQPLVLNTVLEPSKSMTPSSVSRTKQPKTLPLVTSTPTLVTCGNCKAVLDASALVNKNVKTVLICSVCHSQFHAMQQCRLDSRHIQGRELDQSTIESTTVKAVVIIYDEGNLDCSAHLGLEGALHEAQHVQVGDSLGMINPVTSCQFRQPPYDLYCLLQCPVMPENSDYEIQRCHQEYEGLLDIYFTWSIPCIQKLDLPVAETVRHSVSTIITAIKMMLGQSQINWLVSNIRIDDSSYDDDADDYADNNDSNNSNDNDNGDDDDAPADDTCVTSNASGESAASTSLAADNSDANMTDTEAAGTPMTQVPLLGGTESQQLHDTNSDDVNSTHLPLIKESKLDTSLKTEHHPVKTPATPSAASARSVPAAGPSEESSCNSP
eukprot:1879868-Rhodomonas_salina.1